uniref:Uncharacterized protein n=1 Tax=Anguilla anguilla TaxID=7936 RepID=A0A0E9S176_ANGAN
MDISYPIILSERKPQKSGRFKYLESLHK